MGTPGGPRSTPALNCRAVRIRHRTLPNNWQTQSSRKRLPKLRDAFARRASKQFIHDVLLAMEAGAFEQIKRFREIEQTMRRRHCQDAESTSDPKTFAPGDENTIPIIHENHIGMKFAREDNRVSFAGVKHGQSRIGGANDLTHFCPRWRIVDPLLNRWRRFRVPQFVPHCGGEDHFVEQCRENIDAPDEDQVIYRAGVGDDEPHSSESQALEVFDIAPDIIDCHLGPDMVGLQEAVKLVPGFKTQKAA